MGVEVKEVHTVSFFIFKVQHLLNTVYMSFLGQSRSRYGL